MDSENQINISQEKLKQFYKEENKLLRDYFFQNEQQAKEVLPLQKELERSDIELDADTLSDKIDYDYKLIFHKSSPEYFPYKEIRKAINEIANDKRVVLVYKVAIILLIEVYYRIQVFNRHIEYIAKELFNVDSESVYEWLKDYKTYLNEIKDDNSFKSVSLNSSQNKKEKLGKIALMMLKDSFEEMEDEFNSINEEQEKVYSFLERSYNLSFDKIIDLLSTGSIRKFEKALFPVILNYIILKTDLKGFKPKSEVRRELLSKIFKITHPSYFTHEDFELTDKQLYRRQQVRTIIGV